VYLFWLPGIIFGSYGYLKVAVSDRVAFEKPVRFRLAVLMSLDIIDEIAIHGCCSKKFIVLKIDNLLTKFHTSVYYPNPGETIIQF